MKHSICKRQLWLSVLMRVMRGEEGSQGIDTLALCLAWTSAGSSDSLRHTVSTRTSLSLDLALSHLQKVCYHLSMRYQVSTPQEKLLLLLVPNCCHVGPPLATFWNSHFHLHIPSPQHPLWLNLCILHFITKAFTNRWFPWMSSSYTLRIWSKLCIFSLDKYI